MRKGVSLPQDCVPDSRVMHQNGYMYILFIDEFI